MVIQIAPGEILNERGRSCQMGREEDAVRVVWLSRSGMLIIEQFVLPRGSGHSEKGLAKLFGSMPSGPGGVAVEHQVKCSALCAFFTL